MATGFLQATYTTDRAVALFVKVEADRFADPSFDWDPGSPGGLTSGYGSVKPRRVYGIEAVTGARASAIVPKLDSPLWTGGATQFVNKDDDGVEHTFTVTGYRGELVHISH